MRNGQVLGENITDEKQLQWANKCKRFVLDNGTLIRLLPNGETRICVTRSRGGKLVAATHNAKGKHLTLPMTKQLIFFSPYWWPTIDEDIKYHAEYECEECMLEPNTKQEEMSQKGELPNSLEEISPTDWRKPYLEYLVFGRVISNNLTGEEEERIANRSQFFSITNGKLMRKFVPNETPKECISENRILELLRELHRKHQTSEEMIAKVTQGPYWWPTVTSDIRSFIKQCSNCNQRNGTTPNQRRNDTTKGDWRIPIVEYLTNGKNRVHQIKQGKEIYFMEEGELRKEANHEESKICIAGEQIKNLIKRVHDQDNWHIEPINTIQQIFNGPYWWPTIVQDTNDYINGECPKCKGNTTTKIQCGAITTDPQEDWRTPFIDYLSHGRLTTPATLTQRQQIAIRSRPFQLVNGDKLIKEGADGMKRRCVSGPITEAIIAEAHEGIAGGHFAANITLHKILTALYWWPTMKRDVYIYCKQCDICQRVGPKVSKSSQPLHPIIYTEVFQRWGLDIIGPINHPPKGTKNKYIITATDYTTK